MPATWLSISSWRSRISASHSASMTFGCKPLGRLPWSRYSSTSDGTQRRSSSWRRGSRAFPAPSSGASVRRSFRSFADSCLVWMGRLREGLDEVDSSRRQFEQVGRPDMVCTALLYTATGCYRANDADGALASARHAEEISRRVGEPRSWSDSHSSLSRYAHLAAGRSVDAVERARHALEVLSRGSTARASRRRDAPGRGPAAGRRPVVRADRRRRRRSSSASRALRAQFEGWAHGVMARALLRRDGAAARNAVEAELASAAALIEARVRAHSPPRSVSGAPSSPPCSATTRRATSCCAKPRTCTSRSARRCTPRASRPSARSASRCVRASVRAAPSPPATRSRSR